MSKDDLCAKCEHVRESHFEQRDRDCNGQRWDHESEQYVECECCWFEESVCA